jgi:nucleoid-associated protein EbfC
MSVFSKLKQFKDLRDQGKKLQETLVQESTTTEAAFGRVKLTMDGTMNLTKVEIDPELLSHDKQDKLQTAIKDAHNDALKKIQRTVAAKMQQSGFEMPSLK